MIKGNRWYIVPLMMEVETTLNFLVNNNNLGIEATSKELIRAVQDEVIKNYTPRSKKELKNVDLAQTVYTALATILERA